MNEMDLINLRKRGNYNFIRNGRVSSIQAVVVRGMGKNAVVPMDNDLKAEKQKIGRTTPAIWRVETEFLNTTLPVLMGSLRTHEV